MIRDSNTPHQQQLTHARGENLSQLIELLRGMFQLDRGDLDFGFYRVMNLKAKEIETFLTRDLPSFVDAELEVASVTHRTELLKDLSEARESARNLGVDIEAVPKIIQLKKSLAAYDDIYTGSDVSVFNHLATFFGRFYHEGDFMSLRRYTGSGQSTYLVPYDGEEVKLHWSNADQYYVKTAEDYSTYRFTFVYDNQTHHVQFEVTSAHHQNDNVKETNGKQRRFVLAVCAVEKI